MSERPHSVAIGAFVIGALLILATVFLFLLGAGFGKKEKVVMVFNGSVKGLNVGAPLALRGVKIGQVTKINVVLDPETVELILVVEADFDESKIAYKGKVLSEGSYTEELLSRGLRAQLNSQSLLTGLLYIQLDFHPDSELKLADIDSPYLQLPTVPTDLERIAKKLQEIDISQLIDDFKSITDSINSFVGNDQFKALPANMTDTLDSLTELSDQLQEQLTSTGPRVDTVLDEAAVTVANVNTQLPRIAKLVEINLGVLEGAIKAIEKTIDNFDGLVSQDSETIYRLNSALQDVSRASVALKSLATTLEEQPEALIRGKSGDQ